MSPIIGSQTLWGRAIPKNDFAIFFLRNTAETREKEPGIRDSCTHEVIGLLADMWVLGPPGSLLFFFPFFFFLALLPFFALALLGTGERRTLWILSARILHCGTAARAVRRDSGFGDRYHDGFAPLGEYCSQFLPFPARCGAGERRLSSLL